MFAPWKDEMEQKIIHGKKNEAADMLSRNEFIQTPNMQVNTVKFEAMIHEMYTNEISVPIGYQTIYKYKQDDAELLANTTNITTTGKSKVE